ncbi:uncharacterized protein LOC117102250 [Anneissia japonica]|uniref:uncharacterized protein LOC117102250 n=1 Tax=Anneissia japonica TaxID=1529436 RepID=UPI0014259593|nr:uncharacterized protein LOC117102250 [Anneissia japonica]XP_033098374.1 uncharacterized protein LOC117102250 [Anneissia japonica]
MGNKQSRSSDESIRSEAGSFKRGSMKRSSSTLRTSTLRSSTKSAREGKSKVLYCQTKDNCSLKIYSLEEKNKVVALLDCGGRVYSNGKLVYPFERGKPPCGENEIEEEFMPDRLEEETYRNLMNSMPETTARYSKYKGVVDNILGQIASTFDQLVKDRSTLVDRVRKLEHENTNLTVKGVDLKRAQIKLQRLELEKKKMMIKIDELEAKYDVACADVKRLRKVHQKRIIRPQNLVLDDTQNSSEIINQSDVKSPTTPADESETKVGHLIKRGNSLRNEPRYSPVARGIERRKSSRKYKEGNEPIVVKVRRSESERRARRSPSETMKDENTQTFTFFPQLRMKHVAGVRANRAISLDSAFVEHLEQQLGASLGIGLSLQPIPAADPTMFPPVDTTMRATSLDSGFSAVAKAHQNTIKLDERWRLSEENFDKIEVKKSKMAMESAKMELKIEALKNEHEKVKTSLQPQRAQSLKEKFKKANETFENLHNENMKADQQFDEIWSRFAQIKQKYEELKVHHNAQQLHRQASSESVLPPLLNAAVTNPKQQPTAIVQDVK